MDCQDCGEPTENEFEICAGAAGYERMNNDHPVLDYRGLTTCNCCEKCRERCFNSMHEEYETD